MIFNSIEFIIFFIVTFSIYWFVLADSIKGQNVFILICSYFFYGWWDWRFLSLIAFSSVVDFFVAQSIEKSSDQRRRKWLLYLSLLTNLGILGVFKYFNFFAENFEILLASIGFQANALTLNVLLPVGISFYTFQTLSYTIDVYKKQMKASDDPIAFFAYVAFFPQLVAGPIERAKKLLPQFSIKRTFDYNNAIEGSKQILWGFFKKVVVADNCAAFVDIIFENYDSLPGYMLVLGAVLFAFQIYGDFSGYSDIAIGTARLFGFDLMQNFAFPYFSRDIAEFWRRWHISLSTWFRDYLYIPLGGSRVGQGRAMFNIFAIFLVSGFWHGANWTFIFWGFLNALYFMPQFVFKTNRKYLDVVAKDSVFPDFRECFAILITFTLTCLAWIFFRAPTITDAFYYIANIASLNTDAALMSTIFTNPFYLTVVYLILMLVIEWKNRFFTYGFKHISSFAIIRYLSYALIFYLVTEYFFGERTFIYFQF